MGGVAEGHAAGDGVAYVAALGDCMGLVGARVWLADMKKSSGVGRTNRIDRSLSLASACGRPRRAVWM